MKKKYIPSAIFILVILILLKNNYANAQGFRPVEPIQQTTQDPNRFPPKTPQGTINDAALNQQKIDLSKAQIDRFARSAVPASSATAAAAATAATEAAAATEAITFGRLAGAAAAGAIRGDIAGGVVGPGAVTGAIVGAAIGIAAALLIANAAKSQPAPVYTPTNQSNMFTAQDYIAASGAFGEDRMMSAILKLQTTGNFGSGLGSGLACMNEMADVFQLGKYEGETDKFWADLRAILSKYLSPEEVQVALNFFKNAGKYGNNGLPAGITKPAASNVPHMPPNPSNVPHTPPNPSNPMPKKPNSPPILDDKRTLKDYWGAIKEGASQGGNLIPIAGHLAGAVAGAEWMLKYGTLPPHN